MEAADTSLTLQEQNFVKEQDTRNSVAREILETPPSLKEKALLFWNDAKEKLGYEK
jgi:hypothetical protein